MTNVKLDMYGLSEKTTACFVQIILMDVKLVMQLRLALDAKEVIHYLLINFNVLEI